ncbi:MAG TPA: ElyC/SanA/YdcF family protein, partial [Casimicrobiaceae bacterium]|nr:ElyC/SanA/YdcF family protein [Casimicrobiaceae bacterium]
HNTRENAEASAAILKAAGVSRIILVGHAFDFPRTRNEFEAAGLTVIGAPIGVASEGPYSALDFVPGLGGLQASYFACYEILANIFYRFMH